MSDDSLLGPNHPDADVETVELKHVNRVLKDRAHELIESGEGGVPFHQYLIAVGAFGTLPEGAISKLLYEAGLRFAHEAGLEAVLCMGHVSPEAFGPQYLDVATVWRDLPKQSRESVRYMSPRMYQALMLLAGTKQNDPESFTNMDSGPQDNTGE